MPKMLGEPTTCDRARGGDFCRKPACIFFGGMLFSPLDRSPRTNRDAVSYISTDPWMDFDRSVKTGEAHWTDGGWLCRACAEDVQQRLQEVLDALTLRIEKKALKRKA